MILFFPFINQDRYCKNRECVAKYPKNMRIYTPVVADKRSGRNSNTVRKRQNISHGAERPHIVNGHKHPAEHRSCGNKDRANGTCLFAVFNYRADKRAEYDVKTS